MTDQKALGEPNEGATPDDVATLYSWANLHGAKYRDFSSSRALAREEARQRVEEALAAERQRKAEEDERKAQEEAQLAARLAAEAAEAARQAEAERLAEIARQAEAERQAVLAAQEAQRQAAQQRVWQPPPPEAYGGAYAPAFTPIYPAQPDSFSTGSFNRPAFDGPAFDTPSFLEGQSALIGEGGGSGQPRVESQPTGTQFLPRQPYINPSQTELQVGQAPGNFVSPLQEPRREAWVDLPSAPSSPAQAPPAQIGNHPSANRPAGSHPVAGTSMQERQATAGQAARPETSQSSSNVAYPRYASPTSLPVAYPERGPVEGRGGQFGAQPPMPATGAGLDRSSYGAAASDSLAPYSWQAPEVQEPREGRDSASRPAWLAPEIAPSFSSNSAVQAQYSAGTMSSPAKPAAATPQAGAWNGQGAGQEPVDDTLLGSRDRIANRWYALKSVFDPHAAPVEPQPVQSQARVPMLAVFSLAGGVGKTSIVAALGRALSSRGERILLVDTATYGLLPFFFGARDQRPGILRTFTPPGLGVDAPIQLVTLDPDGQPPAEQAAETSNADARKQDRGNIRSYDSNQDWLLQEVGRYSRGMSRVVVDLPTASGATTRRVMRMGPTVLVPVVPDMSSVVSVGAIESFFRNSASAVGKPNMPYYVLNQFDYSLPLHLDVREILREQIGDRLLPFALRRSPAISEALAEGMTVMDYAPAATVAEDYASLAGWVRSIAAPATVAQRGVRWSER